jgi:hypothetical protein
VNETRSCKERDGYEHEGDEAVNPGRSAEEQPPHDHSESAAEDSAQNPVERSLGNDAGQDHPGQPLQHHGEYAGPHSERFRPE